MCIPGSSSDTGPAASSLAGGTGAGSGMGVGSAGSPQQPCPAALLDLPEDLLLHVLQRVVQHSREAFCTQRLVCRHVRSLVSRLASSLEVTDSMLLLGAAALPHVPGPKPPVPGREPVTGKEHGEPVQQLELGNTRLPGHAMQLPSAFPKLEKLRWGCLAAPSPAFEHLLRCQFLTRVVPQLSALRTLDLLCSFRDWWMIEDPTFPNWLDWDASGFCHSVSREHLALVAAACPRLTSLSCSVAAMSCLHPLSALGSLSHLRATGATSEGPQDGACLARLPPLSSLYLDCPGPHTLAWLRTLTQLTALSLLVGVRRMELQCPAASGLLVRTARHGPAHFGEAQCAALLAALPALHVLALNTHHPLGRASLAALGRLPRLRRLCLHCSFDLDGGWEEKGGATPGWSPRSAPFSTESPSTAQPGPHHPQQAQHEAGPHPASTGPGGWGQGSPVGCGAGVAAAGAAATYAQPAPFQSLETLHVERAWDLSPAVLCALGLAAPLPHLRRLLLTDCFLVGLSPMLSLVAGQTTLRELLLNDCGFSDPGAAAEGGRCRPAALLALSRLSGLTTLHVDLTGEPHDISPGLARLLPCLPHLHTFGLRSSIREVGPRGRSPSCLFPVLAALPRLHSLSFHRIVAPELDCPPLPPGAFAALRSLQLTCCVDHVAATLGALGSAALPLLLSLSVTQSRIKAPDALLRLVAGHSSLRRVELEEFEQSLSESGLLQLTSLDRLEHLTLLGPGVLHLGAEQLDRLRAALPALQELQLSRAG